MNRVVQALRPVVLGVAVAITAGCASTPSVSENQCRAGDWRTIGYRDGAAGFDSTRLLMHQEACGSFDIVPERSAYMTGWQEGLVTFCTADNGFNQGLWGKPLNGVCREDLREPYATAHADGRQLYSARQEVRHLQQNLANQERRLDQIKQEMVGATTAQLVPDLTPEERLNLLAKLEDLADERAAIKAELPLTEQALIEAEDHLASLDRNFAVR